MSKETRKNKAAKTTKSAKAAPRAKAAPAARAKTAPAARAKAAAPAPRAKAAPAQAPAGSAAPTDESESFSLLQAHERLGEPSAALERALRKAHPSDELHAEGAKVASPRIVREGERLCSKALVHLTSKDADVQAAVRSAGLTQPWLALSVDALLRLSTEAGGVSQQQSGGKAKKQLQSASLETAVAAGKHAKAQVLPKLRVAAVADAKLKAALDELSASAADDKALLAQLEGLAAQIIYIENEASEDVRVLAEGRGLGQHDADVLKASAEALRSAREQQSGQQVRSEEQQARLDVLDGFCLLLLREVLRALRAMADRTPKVRRPVLTALKGYFRGSSGHAEEDDSGHEESPGSPSPAPR